jgi:hypothetical protein
MYTSAAKVPVPPLYNPPGWATVGSVHCHLALEFGEALAREFCRQQADGIHARTA